MSRTYLTEFSSNDYPMPPALLHVLQEKGWEDTSWHNDSCPTWAKRRVGEFWLEALSPRLRETEGKRFTLISRGKIVWETDDEVGAIARLQEL